MSAPAFALAPNDAPRRGTSAELDLSTVADAAGLNPKGRGRNFAFDCPDCGRKGKASGRRDGPWHCFSCDAKGNALTLARRFELAGAELPRPTVQPPATPNRNGVAPSMARAAWSALEGRREVYRDRLTTYLEEARGWPAELARAGAAVPGWAWIPGDDCPELPRSLAWITRDDERRAAFALRNARGEVWTLERRWTAPAPPADPDTPKAKRLPTRPDDREELAIFGRVPDAVAAAARGEPVYLCEGGPDYLAAAAFTRIEGRGAALGAHGHHGLPKVAAVLRAALEAAAAPVAGVRVLCVPHLGDKGDVGARSMLAAADVLAGCGAVHNVRVPVDATGKGDLADAARGGAHDLRALFEAPELLYAAPVDLADKEAATEQIGAAILRALQASDGPNTLALVIMPPGVGKTTAAFERAARLARQRRRVVFALPDHENAGKKLAEFSALYPDVPAVHAKGMPSLCELPARHPDKREAIERAAAAMGRKMCAGCPLASREEGGTCEGWRRPKARAGVVTFAAHAGLEGLARKMKPADLVIIDELPALVNVREVGPTHLRTMSAGSLAARRWYRDNPGHRAFAVELAAAAESVAAETPPGLYAARVDLPRVLEGLRERPDALEAAADVLAELAADPDPENAPAPTPEEARRGAADRWPDAGACKLVRDLARAVLDPEHPAELGCLRIEAAGAGWAFETRRLFELPDGPRVLALDASGEISRAEWTAIGARHGRTLAAVTVTAIGEKPASAVHYRTERLRTARLWARKGRRVQFRAEAPGALRNALLRAAGGLPCALGVLTHKPAADALRWGVALAANPQADPPDGVPFEADDRHALEVAALAADLCSRGWQLVIGHFGRDDRASNDFENVDALAILGAPRPDFGAVAEDGHALGIDAEALATARTTAATVQALARARYLRRAGVRLFLAADCEAPTGPELPGVAWTVEQADRSHAPTVSGIDAAQEIAVWADRTGCLDVAAVLAVLTPQIVGRHVAERLCRLEAERRGWPLHRRGRARVYGVHSENMNDSASLYAHGEGDRLSDRGPEGPGALLLDPMSVQRPDIVDKNPVIDIREARSGPGQSARPGQAFEAMPPELTDIPPAEYDRPPVEDDRGRPPWGEVAAG
jgi:hypothetical protein